MPDFTLPDFRALLADVGKFQAALAKIHATIPPGKESQILSEVMAKLEENKVIVQAEIPKVMAKQEEQKQHIESGLAEGRAKMARLKAKMEEAQQAAQEKAAPLPMPPKPELRLDEGLGQRLRISLLTEFGKLPPAEEPSEESIKEIWQDWS